MYWSHFTKYMVENGKYLPKKKREDILRRGKERYIERLQAGRADCELRFDDLINEAEDYVSGRK